MHKFKAKKLAVDELDEPNGDPRCRSFDYQASWAETSDYLQRLTGSETRAAARAVPLTWRCIHPGYTPPSGEYCRGGHPRTYLGSYRELQQILWQANLNQGYGIFVMPNAPDFDGLFYDDYGCVHCFESDIQAVRAIYADFDEKLSEEPIDLKVICDACPIPPSFAVRTGHGIHCYWRLRAPKVLETDADRVAVKGMLMTLARTLRHLGADPAVVSLAQALRCPGFLNTKRLPEAMGQMIQVPAFAEVDE